MEKSQSMENIQKLARMLDNKQLLSHEDISGILTDIVNAFAQYRSATGEINKETKDTLNLIVKQVNAEHDRILKDVENSTGKAKSDVTGRIKDVEKMLADCKKMCDEMIAMKPVDGLDGKDADEEKVIEDVLAKIKLPENRVVTPEETRDMLASLEGEKRLDITSIKGWNNIIDNLVNKAQQSFSSGISYLNRLVDVSLSSPTNGQVLTYNSTTQKWYNSTAAGGGDMVLANVQTNSGAKTFLNNTLLQRNPANTFSYTIAGGAIVADRILNLPVLTGTDTVATLGLTQTFTNNMTFSGNSGGPEVTITNTGAGVGLNVDDMIVTAIELGNASDTTLTRVSAGVMAVEGATVATLSTAQTFTATQTFPQQINTNNAITATANAATVPITSRLSTVTNNSAATLTITITTASAVDGMLINIRVLDFSAVAQTITWVNTENSTVTAPVTSNGSTTLPVTTLFQYNAGTSKWRCIASV